MEGNPDVLATGRNGSDPAAGSISQAHKPAIAGVATHPGTLVGGHSARHAAALVGRVGQRRRLKSISPREGEPVAPFPLLNQLGEGVICTSCGYWANAGLNAAQNILASGIGATARGEAFSPETSMIRETGPGHSCDYRAQAPIY